MPSVFDAFEAVPKETPFTAEHIRTAVVSLGTELWPFQRAVDRALELLPDTDIYWQTGVTEATRDGRTLQQWVPAADLRRAFGESDVVLTHAGVGSALVALEEGAVPVILPRRQAHGEMIDDHQVEFADMMVRRSLAVSVDPDELSMEHILRAANLGRTTTSRDLRALRCPCPCAVRRPRPTVPTAAAGRCPAPATP